MPDWNRLYEIAAAQDGYFTTVQASEPGYSPQLLNKYLKNGRVQHIRYGIYRIVHFPASEHEDLAELWLWSSQEGVFSHETALFLHNLSDALPTNVHMTLPESWESRRLRVPEGLVIYYADIPTEDRAWYGAVPITSPARTVLDCAHNNVDPDLIAQAIIEGIARGLFSREIIDVAAESIGRHDLIESNTVG